ncbi:MAG: YqjK-like family protein [Candidatus Nitrotoga sp.]
MKKRLAALMIQRHELLEKIVAQRMEMAEITQHWQKPLAFADAGLKAVRFIHDHPGLVSGGIAVLLSLRGIGIAGMAQKGWRLLYLYPSLFSFGLKFLFAATRSRSTGKNNDANA